MVNLSVRSFSPCRLIECINSSKASERFAPILTIQFHKITDHRSALLLISFDTMDFLGFPP